MKKLILLFALLLSVSSSFISCRETAEEERAEEAAEAVEERTDEIEDAADEMEDDY
jgi:outer membrane lipoprotein-sorting protein